MRISSVLVENIKKFNPKAGIFSFGGLPGMHTLSGGNGSGKTAIFRSVQIFQKIFFFDQLDPKNNEYEKLYKTIFLDLESLMSAERAIIDIDFKIESYSLRVILNLEKKHNSWHSNFTSRNENDIKLLSEQWNIDNPKGIVAFIDASKSFSEFGVSFDEIKLSPRRERHRKFILDCIFEPEKTLQSIYHKTVIDHVQYRIDPKRPYKYFRDANIAVKSIADNIEVVNISATKIDGELVIVGRTNKKAPLFDIKDFSSGERALYLTLLFLYYLPNIGILIIDEPENHLHESLLCRFYDFLADFMNSDPKTNKEQIDINLGSDEESQNYKLPPEQIFLTTHSKALIYKNMNKGFSFGMAQDRILPIQASEIERSLRASGISTVYSKTIFVEGDTEASLMGDFFDEEMVTITPVNNCKEVISYFEKISSIRSTIHGAAFCFVIDSDNRTETEINEIKNKDPDFFDQSFCILDRHEIENLFIEEKLITEVINHIRKAIDLSPFSIAEIEKIMLSEANDLFEISKNKYISSGLKMILKNTITDPIIDVKK